MYTDTHCHLTDERYEDVNEIIKNYKDAGVDLAIIAGFNEDTSVRGGIIAESNENLYHTVGVHPSDIDELKDSTLTLFRDLAKKEKCVAIGEIGLDYHFEEKSLIRDKQIKGFQRQLELAHELSLPVCIHSRDSAEDTTAILKEGKNLIKNGLVMHCYSGSLESAKIYLNEGFYISFSGSVTFKNARGLVDVCKYVPLDRLLTETDCPYLCPEPFRGRRNEPKNVTLVAQKIAEYKGASVEKVCESVRENTLSLFKKICKP